jgi:hypothetical protein
MKRYIRLAAKFIRDNPGCTSRQLTNYLYSPTACTTKIGWLIRPLRNGGLVQVKRVFGKPGDPINHQNSFTWVGTDTDLQYLPTIRTDLGFSREDVQPEPVIRSVPKPAQKEPELDLPSDPELRKLIIFKRWMEIHAPEFDIESDRMDVYVELLGKCSIDVLDKMLTDHTPAARKRPGTLQRAAA